MAVPDFQSFMLPVLQLAADGKEHSIRELHDCISKRMGLTDSDIEEKLPSGMQTKYSHRVHWATVYLAKAGALIRPRRGVITITERGRELVAENHSKITVKVLQRFPEFVEFHKGDPVNIPSAVTKLSSTDDVEQVTPEETLESSFAVLQGSLASELLGAVKKASPGFFEALVVKLLVAMGYGGSVEDAGKVIGKSGDAGIDGIINEDKLGLDVVYVQAKKWGGTVVGRPVVQAFAGSLEGRRARKGIIITTSTFSQEAHEYVQRIEKKIVLIDGKRLAELMVEHNVGVAVAKTYAVKKIDNDFFEEE